MPEESDVMRERLQTLLVETDTEFVTSLIDLFQSEGEEIYAAIVRASEAGDLRVLERAAHSLKGAAANVGAMDLLELCKTVEHAAHAGEVRHEDVQQLGRMLPRVGSMLAAFRTQLTAGGGR